MRYRPSDLARLGDHAREQIRLAQIAADFQRNLEAEAKQARRKYGNRPCELDGHRFDSQAEMHRYAELRRLHRAGIITELVVHPVYRLEVAGVLVCKYVADFSYHGEDGGLVVEDVKATPTKTPGYRIKAKLLKALHGITIQEIMT